MTTGYRGYQSMTVGADNYLVVETNTRCFWRPIDPLQAACFCRREALLRYHKD